MTTTADAEVAEICAEYQRLRDGRAPVRDAVRAIEPWLRAQGPEGLMEVLWEFAWSSSGSRSDFSLDEYGPELHAAVRDGVAGPGLADSFRQEIVEWMAAFVGLAELTDEIMRTQRLERPSATRGVPLRNPAVRESAGVIPQARHEVAAAAGRVEHPHA